MQKELTRILLIDDLSTTRMLCRLELKRLGFLKVDEAEDGLTALSMICASARDLDPYSLIICDWDMPGLTGIELLEMVKQDPSIWLIPFVMLSGEPSITLQKKAFDLGAMDYLIKPISPDSLAKKIEQIIEIARQAA